MAVQIITGDRDNLQLVTEHSHVFLTKKGISDMLEVTLDNMEELSIVKKPYTAFVGVPKADFNGGNAKNARNNKLLPSIIINFFIIHLT